MLLCYVRFTIKEKNPDSSWGWKFIAYALSNHIRILRGLIAYKSLSFSEAKVRFQIWNIFRGPVFKNTYVPQ